MSADERLARYFTPAATLPQTMAAAEPGAVWVPCGHCGAQGRIWTPVPDGGYIPGICPWCLGLTAVLR